MARKQTLYEYCFWVTVAAAMVCCILMVMRYIANSRAQGAYVLSIRDVITFTLLFGVMFGLWTSWYVLSFKLVEI
jgi:hypothetical protein